MSAQSVRGGLPLGLTAKIIMWCPIFRDTTLFLEIYDYDTPTESLGLLDGMISSFGLSGWEGDYGSSLFDNLSVSFQCRIPSIDVILRSELHVWLVMTSR